MDFNNNSAENVSFFREDVRWNRKSPTATLLLSVVISFLLLLTILGNAFVMLSFVVDSRLRNQSNFILLNLAICDFLIGAFSSPLYLLYMLTGKWILGRFLCKLWLTVDYTVCTASVFNVVFISYDRFLSVTNAVLYRSLQNNHRQTFRSMAALWIVSFLLYGPAIIFWENESNYYNGSVIICLPGFNEVWYFHFGVSCVAFAVPLISISFFNVSIYCNIKRRSRKKILHFISQYSNGSKRNGCLSIITTDSALGSQQLHRTRDVGSPLHKEAALSLRCCFSSRTTSSNTHNHDCTENKHTYVTISSRDQKAATFLTSLVCVFVICWAPYTFLVIIRAACNGYCVDSYWYDITIWMLYMNSAINPFLYPLCHNSFRKAFHLVFKKCQKMLQI